MVDDQSAKVLSPKFLSIPFCATTQSTNDFSTKYIFGTNRCKAFYYTAFKIILSVTEPAKVQHLILTKSTCTPLLLAIKKVGFYRKA